MAGRRRWDAVGACGSQSCARAAWRAISPRTPTEVMMMVLMVATKPRARGSRTRGDDTCRRPTARTKQRCLRRAYWSR
eukprot:1534368-Pleurochrysis_carterae.AAC.2